MRKEENRFDPKVFARGRCCVLGLGRSGFQVAKLLSRKGFKVLVSDTRPHKEIRPMARKLGAKVQWEAGGHSDRILKAKFAVKSPGIPSHCLVLERLAKAKIPIFSELEVSLALSPARDVVAITGTNGKSTTTLLATAVFTAARKRAHACGNVGVPVSLIAPKAGKNDVLVIEASSYQLEDSRYFHPASAAILNVTADHIDHHGGMERYIQAKARVFKWQNRADDCVFNADDPITVKLARQCPARKLFFSHHKSTLSHAWIEKGAIRLRLPRAKKEIKLTPPKLPGAHNLENAMAVALIALDRGISSGAIQRAFKGFKGVEHRIEDCAMVRGIRCINDSKATNVESTLTALKALSQPASKEPRIMLILGGLHKGYPYTPLHPFLGTAVKGILTIGSAAKKVEEDLSGPAPIFPCKDLATAVRTGLQIGRKDDILLLSPACASFDQFKDFEHRGRCFKELLRQAKQ